MIQVCSASSEGSSQETLCSSLRCLQRVHRESRSLVDARSHVTLNFASFSIKKKESRKQLTARTPSQNITRGAKTWRGFDLAQGLDLARGERLPSFKIPTVLNFVLFLCSSFLSSQRLVAAAQINTP